MSCQRRSINCGSWPISLPAHCSSVSFDPPSPISVMPASVSTVTTKLLLLNSVFTSGGAYTRTHVIFILGTEALTRGRSAKVNAEAASDFKKARRFILENQPSERNVCRDLQLSWIAYDRRDRARLGRSDGRIWLAKLRMVKHVERIEA